MENFEIHLLVNDVVIVSFLTLEGKENQRTQTYWGYRTKRVDENRSTAR